MHARKKNVYSTYKGFPLNRQTCFIYRPIFVTETSSYQIDCHIHLRLIEILGRCLRGYGAKTSTTTIYKVFRHYVAKRYRQHTRHSIGTAYTKDDTKPILSIVCSKAHRPGSTGLLRSRRYIGRIGFKKCIYIHKTPIICVYKYISICVAIAQ